MSSTDARIAEARALRAAGDSRAAAAYAQLLSTDPGCTEAHVALADFAEARGDLRAALEHRQQACRTRPTDPRLLHALGEAAEACGYVEEAEAAWKFALRIAPTLAVSRLRLGRLYERSGRADDATRAYFRAIASAQMEGQWLDAPTTPAELLDDVTHAMAQVHEGRVRILSALLDPLVARFGDAAMRRVRACLMGYLGVEQVQPAHPAQQPRFLYFPGLPESPFLPRERFDWFPALQARTAALRAEAEAALADPARMAPFLQFGPQDRPDEYLAGSDAPPRWDAVFFYRHGSAYPENAARSPQTWTALESLPLLRIAGHAPEVCFSVLAPGTRILPHHGVTNVRSVVHLPLIVPAGCELRVADDVHRWQEGQCVAFDDTFLHEAHNPSGQTRVILLMDAWNPWLTEPERVAVTALIEGIGAFNRG